jgi:glycosyltransferase involved in cell wall biosynthesis
MESVKSPIISIVITAYTIERINDIFELLDSVQAQTFKDLETIFIIERSEELLYKVNDYIKQKNIACVNAIFSKDKIGLSGARNLGITKAKGKIIAFIDDDVVLFPNWAEEMVKAYHDESTIGVTGPGLPMWEDNKLKWLPEELYWIVSATAFTGWTEERAVRSAWGMNMSFRREAFNQCLFSTNFGQTTGGKEAWKAGPVDDAEFSIKLRLKTKKAIMYNPLVQVYHKVYIYRLTRKFIRGQCYWQGYSKALLKKMYPDDADTKALVKEMDLLKRILLKLIPRSLLGLFRNPSLYGKRLFYTSYVLFYVALGYSAGAQPRIFGFTEKSFRA